MKIKTNDKLLVVFTTHEMRVMGSYVAVAMFNDWRQAMDYEMKRNEELTEEEKRLCYEFNVVKIYED